jgi:hypothetical protein
MWSCPGLLPQPTQPGTHEIASRDSRQACTSLMPHKVTIRTIDHGAPKSAPLEYSVVSFRPQCPAVLVEGRLARRCQCHGRRIMCFTSMRPHVGPHTCRRFAGHAARRTIVKRNSRIARRFISHNTLGHAFSGKRETREREGIPINQELTDADTLSHNIIARALAHHIVYL